MAAASLGRLTLDLLVRLGSFEQGLNRAERQASQSASNMSDAFRGFGDQIRESLGGTQLGSLIGDVTTRLEGMQGSVLIATAGLAGLAAGGTVLAVAGLSKMAIEAAKADSEMAMLAMRAKVGIENFQIFTYAAEQLGISQDQLGSIFADVQEKLGEFSATGGGGAADFFDALKNNTKLTDDQIKAFSKTLQGKDGVEAVQMLKDKLDDLGASSQEQRFVFESLGSDLGNLLPLFANGGKVIDEYGVALNEAGVIKSQEAIQQSQLLAAQTQAINLQFQGAKNQLISGFMPALTGVADAMFGTSKNGLQLTDIGSGLGTIFKFVASVAIGAGQAIKMVGQNLGGVAAIAVSILSGDFRAVPGIAKNMLADTQDSFYDFFAKMDKMWNFTGTVATTSSNKLVNASLALDAANIKTTSSLKTNTKEAEENAKAAEKQAVAKAKLNKELQVNAKVQANADKFGFASLESQYKLPNGLLSAINMQESRGNANAIGPMTKYGTAKGGFQFLDGTAKRFGLVGNEVFNTGKSAEAAAKYFQFLYEKFGSWEKAISAYHAGEGNVERGTGLGSINREYVKNVLGYMDAALKGVGTTANDAIQYVDETYKAQQSIISKYLNEQEKLELEHAISIQEIREAFAENYPRLAKYITLQQAAYEKDVAKYQEAQKQKELSDKKQLLEASRNWMTAGDYAREYYALVREEILNTAEYSPEMKNALVKQANIQQGVEENSKREQVWSDYQSMMGLEKSPYQQDMDLLAEARKQMLITEEEYQQQRLGMQMAYGAQYGADFAGMMMGLVDQSSSAYAILYSVQKGFNLASAIMNGYTAISAAWASAPFPYNLPAVAMATMETGVLQAAISAVSPVGMAHDGIDNIPKEGTWLLDGGERVLNPNQNKDLTNYLSQAQSNSGQQSQVNLNPNFVIVDERESISDYLFSPDGTKAFVKFFKRNKAALGV